MPEKKRTIVFNLSVLYALDEMYPIIKQFAMHGWQVVLHFGVRYEIQNSMLNDLRQHAIDIHFAPLELSYVKAKPATENCSKEAPESGQKKIIRLSLWNRFNDFVAGVLHGLSAKRYSREFLRRIRPDVVLSNNFLSCCKLDNAMIAYCKTNNVASYCLLVAAYASKKHSQSVRINNVRIGMLGGYLEDEYDGINKTCAKLFPSWIYTHETNSIFPFDPVLMLAAKATNLLPADPWQNPLIDFDGVFVKDQYSRKLLIESDYREDKVFFFGNPRLDSAFEIASNPSLTSFLYADLGLSKNESFILWNIEPGFEHNYATHKEHWQYFTSIHDILKNTGLKVVLSMHPCCNSRDYEFVESDDSFIISMKYKIHMLYPFCKFAVSHPCSTNIYGSYFEKVVVVHDFHNLRANTHGFTEKYCHQYTVVVDNFEQLRLQVETLAQKPDDTVHGHEFIPAASKIYEYIDKNKVVASCP